MSKSSKCTLTPDAGGIAIKTPYDPGFVASLKNKIPYTARQYRPETKTWLIATQYGGLVQDLCNEYFGELPLLPQMLASKPITQQKILDVRYIGACKDRGSDERSAYGWFNDGWNVIFPESVLRAWFEGTTTMPDQAQTLYSVLLVSRTATADEIKSGYRRMVRQWHPDVCKEPNAHEQFIAIQHAYDILSNQTKRERYDAGLALEASLHNTPQRVDYSAYRSSLRCGLILCNGIEVLGKFQVQKIMQWLDITDAHGRVLVVSWKAGADHFEEVWC